MLRLFRKFVIVLVLSLIVVLFRYLLLSCRNRFVIASLHIASLPSIVNVVTASLNFVWSSHRRESLLWQIVLSAYKKFYLTWDKRPSCEKRGALTFIIAWTYNPGQKSWDIFAKTPQIRASPLHRHFNVDLKGPSHPESLQALSTLLGVGTGRAVTKTVWYKQSNRLTQGIFHKCPILRVFFPGVPRTFGLDCPNLALFLKWSISSP